MKRAIRAKKEQIMALRSEGLSAREIAKAAKVSQATVYRVVREAKRTATAEKSILQKVIEAITARGLEESNVRVTFDMDSQDFDELSAIADRLGVSHGTLIREVLYLALRGSK